MSNRYSVPRPTAAAEDALVRDINGAESVRENKSAAGAFAGISITEAVVVQPTKKTVTIGELATGEVSPRIQEYDGKICWDAHLRPKHNGAVSFWIMHGHSTDSPEAAVMDAFVRERASQKEQARVLAAMEAAIGGAQ